MRWSLILSTFAAMQFLISVALVATQNERTLERRTFGKEKEEDVKTSDSASHPSSHSHEYHQTSQGIHGQQQFLKNTFKKMRNAGNKDKNRLFITLHHLFDLPDFHWSLLLAPESESNDKNVRDCHVFHVSTEKVHQSAQVEQHHWQYNEKAVNVLRSRSITARVLVAELSGAESVEEQAQRIDHVLRDIPLRQNDKTFTCRVWVEEALRTLKALGGDFGSIPDITNGGRLEKKILDFAEKARASMEGRVIVHPSDLTELDLRGC